MTTSADTAAVTPPAQPAAPARRSRPIALLLAAVIPGAGHIYLRHPMAGLVWIAVGLAVYATSLVGGLVVHGLCLVHTGLTRPR